MAKQRDARSWAVWGALAGLIVGRLCYSPSFSSIEKINTCLFAGAIAGALLGFILAEFLNSRQ